MARLDFIAILMLEPRLQWIIKLLFNYKQNICASLGVSTAGCAGGRSEDSSAGIARPGMSLPITIRAAWLRPARALPPFSFCVWGPSCRSPVKPLQLLLRVLRHLGCCSDTYLFPRP